MPLTDPIDAPPDGDTERALARLGAVPTAQRRAGCEELLAIASWADLHPGEAVPPVRIHGQERAVRPGGDGTPRVAEFAIAEMAAVLGKSLWSGRRLMADVLDLRHRHPRLWARITHGEVEAWQARKIAQATRPLTLAQARRIDVDIAADVGQLAWGRLQNIVDAAVIAADPDRAAQLAEQARTETKVHFGQSDEHGLATMYARLETPDAVWMKAQVHQLAGLLETVRGDTRPAHQREASALGLLARPTEAVKLLLEQSAPTDEPNVEPEPPDPADADPVDPVGAAIMSRIAALDPSTLAPPAVLYAHLDWDTLTTGSGVCRFEGIGPIVATAAQRWLGDAAVALKPVINLPAEQMPIDAYELSARLREHLHQRQPFSVFPYGVTPARSCDDDHPQPYRWPGPGERLEPGQTGLHNAGPLARGEHRLVTHGGWQRRQPEPGTYLVRAPHGHTWLINNTGTHHLGTGTFADTVWNAAAP